MKRRLLLLLLLVLAGLGITFAVRAPLGPAGNHRDMTATPTFGEGFLEHLDAVQIAAEALVDLGERRERNLLVVGQRQSAMNAALDATDAWLAQQVMPQDDHAVAAYRSGAALIRQSMTDAQSAFLRFDWNSIAAANVVLKQGAAEIAEARNSLISPNGT